MGTTASPAWTPTRVLAWTTDYLERHGDAHSRLSAEWMLSSATGLSRVELYTNYDKPLSADELATMRASVRRRAEGEPLQYVTGEMPFRHIVIRCEPGVLIPRPETEILVDAALEGVDGALASHPVPPAIGPVSEAQATCPVRVIDVGTGSGCIALSIASERRGVQVVATDLSPAAVALAERNRAALGLRAEVDVVECDLVAGVDEDLMGTFSVLVSNPPYIPSAVVPTLPAEVVGFEPGLALDGGADGLDMFRRILEVAPRVLEPGGLLAVELFEQSVHSAAKLVRACRGWRDVEVRDDLTRRPRVLVARWEG